MSTKTITPPKVYEERPPFEATEFDGLTHDSFWQRLGDTAAWFAGADRQTLSYCPSERGRLAGLGVGVLLTGLFGAFASVVALGLMTHQSPAEVWPFGVLWLCIIANIDRLLVMMAGSRRRLAVTVPLRLALAVPIGLLISEILLLQIFAPELTAQLRATQQTSIGQQVGGIEAQYQPRITAALAAASAAQKDLADRQAVVEQYTHLADCEEGEATCSTTGKLGCYEYCQHYRRLATDARVQLEAVRPGLDQQSAAARAEAARFDALRLEAEKAARAAIAGDTGLGARREALEELQDRDPGLSLMVWLLRVSLILLDLMPVMLKALFVLLGKSLYDETAAAMRELESTGAYWLRKLAWYHRRTTDRDFEARDDVDEAVIGAETERRVEAAGAKDYLRRHRPSAEGPLGGVSLADFVEQAPAYEAMAGPVAPALRRLAWFATGLLAATAGLPMLLPRAAPLLPNGWVSLGLLSLCLFLAARTGGFRLASAGLQRVVFGASVGGLLLGPTSLVLSVL